MCTALSFKTKDHYFGRNLDLESTFKESVVIAPRAFPFLFRRMPPMRTHCAMIGMASVVDGYPLYYDATNECGLSIAALNFPGNARYLPETKRKQNITPFEFIPWILGQCASVAQVRTLLERMSLIAISFNDSLPLSPLHFIISDCNTSITVEPMEGRLRIHDNPIGVLTNNPPFDYQMTNLTNYMTLTPQPPRNTLFRDIPLEPFSRGMGALGLPGDLSSVSRFVRAAYMKTTSVCSDSEAESVSQFFHLLGSVRHLRGSVLTDGQYEITQYSSCCNTNKGVYYYTTYENSRITGVDLHAEDLDTQKLICYPLLKQQDILIQNRKHIG